MGLRTDDPVVLLLYYWPALNWIPSDLTRPSRDLRAALAGPAVHLGVSARRNLASGHVSLEAVEWVALIEGQHHGLMCGS